jgi:hypothetical protein
MISEAALHWGRHEVASIIGELDTQARREFNDALAFFQGKRASPDEIYWMLAEQWVRVDAAENQLKNMVSRAEAAAAHLANADKLRSFAREEFELAVKTLRRGIAAPHMPHAGVFRGIEHIRDWLGDWPNADRETLELYGLAAEEVERVERVRYGSIGAFAWDLFCRVGHSHDKHVKALIGPVVGWRLEDHTVRNCFNLFQKKYV